MMRQLERMGIRVRAIGPSTPATAEEAQALRRDHPEIPRVSYLISEFRTDPAKPRPEAEQASEERQIAALLEEYLKQEPVDLIVAGRELEAISIPALAERHGLPWLLRCGGFTLHLLRNGLLQPSLQQSLREALPRAEATIVQAAHTCAAAEEMGCRRVTVIPSLVDLQAFAPRPRPLTLCQRLEIPPQARVVMHASNMKPVKRTADLVDSAARLLAANPDLIYVVAGDGTERPMMEERCRTLGIRHRFRFLGRMPYADMPELFALADVLVMCSAFEQQARVYLEAQAAGRVLVSSDVAGAREVVEDGVTGLLYPVGDVEALASVTQRALDDRRLHESIVIRARERVQAHSLERIGTRVAELMEDVVRRYRLAHG